jgi:hypothetical protein
MEISRRAGRIIVGTPERILAARDAWLAAMAALEVYRLEVNRLWLEYLALADPVRARKIRRILKHAEQGAAKTADELFPAAVSLRDRYHGRKSCGMQLRAIVREVLQLRYAALIKIAHLSDTLNVVYCTAKILSKLVNGWPT